MAPLEMSTPGTAVYRETVEALNALRRSAKRKVLSGASTLSWSDADVTAIRKIARRHKQCTDRLHRIWDGESKDQAEHTRDVYLGAFTTRVCATVRAFAKTRRRGTLQDIYKFAKKLDVWEPLSERVLVELQPKSKGGYRPITKHGPRRMAQQFIVRDLLTALGVDSEYDYCRPGAGGEKAMIQKVCDRIEKGYRYWQTADIKECFASLRPGHFSWLPLPKKLIRNVLFLPKCAKVEIDLSSGKNLQSETHGDTYQGSPYYHMGNILASETVRQGLPQGGVLSPLAARAFVGRELRAALGNNGVARYSYVDDLILGAQSRPEVEKALDALRSRLLQNPAGPVSLHVHPPTSTRYGRALIFGYVLKPGRGYTGSLGGSNLVHVCPGPERFDRFHKKLYARWKAEAEPSDADEFEDFVAARLAHWMPSQQAWTIVPRHSWNVALSLACLYIYERDVETVGHQPGGAMRCASCNMLFERGDEPEMIDGQPYHADVCAKLVKPTAIAAE